MSQVDVSGGGGGFDWSGSLSSLLNVYQGVTTARLEVDKAKYALAAENQKNSLFLPEGVNARAAYATGNAGAYGVQGGMSMPQMLLMSALVFGGGLLLMKAIK